MSKPVIFVVQGVAGHYDEAAAISTLARLTRAMAERDRTADSRGPKLDRESEEIGEAARHDREATTNGRATAPTI